MFSVVIGANYGDEGKGQMTHLLSKSYSMKTLVVRYNGGSQAGHTVRIDEDSRREKHVFQHIGSGTFNNASTLLTKEFISNPMSFMPEWHRLIQYKPQIFVHKESRVSTPFDMIFNGMIEAVREANTASKHGSCGMGIFQTIKRHSDIPLSVGMLSSYSKFELKTALQKIAGYYRQLSDALPDRSGVKSEYTQFLSGDKCESIIDAFVWDCTQFVDIVEIIDDEQKVFDQFTNIIFEGAQGLLLDEKYGEFPHLTPSSVGLEVPARYINDYTMASGRYHPVKVYYLTRPYMTRHGKGPLEYECSKSQLNITFDEDTNPTNEHQGSFRYGHLNVGQLANRVQVDFLNAGLMAADYSVEVTCIDHTPDKFVPIVVDGCKFNVEKSKLRMLINSKLKV